jgi:hypothetical protein
MTNEADADQREHWGMVGHYTIAGAACQLAPAGTKLAQLLRDTAIASPSVTSKSLPATGMNPASGALSSRWLTCRTWCGGAPGPKTPLIISPIWISLVAPRQAGRR